MDEKLDRISLTTTVTNHQPIPLFKKWDSSLQEANIRQFLDAGSKLGLQDFELFEVDGLLEGKDMNAVLWSLSRLAILTNSQQVSWSSYDLYSMGSPTLSTPPSSLANDNRSNTSNNNQHATEQGLHVGNNIPTERGLYYSNKEVSTHQRQDSQGINNYSQHRHSLSSLPDEEDEINWDHHRRPHSPRTLSFGISSTSTPPQTTHKSIKTLSADSGYGTTRQPPAIPTSSHIPLELVSLFDQQQHCPTSTFQESYHASCTDDEDDSGIDHQSVYTSSPIGPSTPPPSSNDTIGKNGKSSISSRLSAGLSLGKKFSLRQKTPFHMRYQEWTETRLNTSTKPSVIHMFDPSEPPLVHPSVSSPLLSKPSKHHPPPSNMISLATEDSATEQQQQPVLDIAQLPPCEAITRRKSTGNLEAQKQPTIDRTPSELADQQDSLKLIDTNGQVIGRYKLGNVIGKGQFGVVYRALELRTGKMMAVKRIKLNSSKKGDLLDVMQEAQLLQQLSHPNIVNYEGIIQTDDHVNIILEYVENGSLLNTLKSFGSFPENLVASYCTRVLHGLCYLHGQNVAHCDLKAANLLTTKAGHVKLSDFGVSLNLGLKETEVGAVAGTPNWMAPEVIELKGASTKSDIWSLGCTIVELCTGKPPYSDLLPMTALFRIVEDDFPPLPDGLSPALCDFLRNCFAKNPDDRPTAEDLLSHSWIRAHEETRTDALDTNVDNGQQSGSAHRPFRRTSFSSPNLNDDLPAWVLPYTDKKDPLPPPTSPSVLADKFQQQQQEHHNYIHQHHSAQTIPHCYVKGTFPKGAVKCKSCHLPIKKDAFICEECGIICHDQCKTSSGCHGSFYNTISTPTLHRQTYTQESADQLLLNAHRSTSRRSNSSYSLQAFLSSTNQNDEATGAAALPPPMPLKPRNSMSTQLRQSTRKLSRVFSSRQPSSSSPNSHRALTHGKSYDTLRQIQEEAYFSKPMKQPPPPPSSSSSYQLEYDSPLSTCSSSSSSSTSPPASSRRESEPVGLQKQSIRRSKIKRRATNPDDCIIS